MGSAHRYRFLAFELATRNSSSNAAHASAHTLDGQGRARNRAAALTVGRSIEAHLAGRGLQLFEETDAKIK